MSRGRLQLDEQRRGLVPPLEHRRGLFLRRPQLREEGRRDPQLEIAEAILVDQGSPGVDLAGTPRRGLAGVQRKEFNDLVVEGDRVQFQVDTARLDPALQALVAAGVRTLTSQPPTLEELFLRHYTGELV